MLEFMFANVNGDPLMKGIVSHWKLAGSLLDLGPAAKHGSGTRVSFTTYKDRPCVAFSGDGYISVPSFTIGSTPWTFSTWIAGYDWTTSYSHILSAAVQATFALKVSKPFTGTPGGTPYFHSASSGNGSQVATAAIPLNTWEMVTYTYNGIDRLRIYIGDTLNVEFVIKPLNVPDSRYRIGNAENTPDEFNRGWMSDLRYWKRELTPAEVLQLWQRTK